MTFTYIFQGATHSDCTQDYMQRQGMSHEQIESVLNQRDFERGQWEAKRHQAYREEADPLYLEWQYDQLPEQEQAWREKVAEIKQRYPKEP